MKVGRRVQEEPEARSAESAAGRKDPHGTGAVRVMGIAGPHDVGSYDVPVG